MNFILRQWRQSDAADVARYADNEQIARNLRDVFPHPYTLADARDYVDSCLAGDPEMSLCRAIAVDDHAVGSIALCRGSDVYQKTAELGYWLAEDFWGRGIMTQTVRQICREGFSRWDIQRIYAEPFAHNIASRRVLEKAGFTLEGIMRRGVFKRGQVCDFCMYALLQESRA